MKTNKLIKLMIESSDANPYSGKLSKQENLLSAIELSKLFKKFADDGYMDEAMGIESEQWSEVINRLQEKINYHKLK